MLLLYIILYYGCPMWQRSLSAPLGTKTQVQLLPLQPPIAVPRTGTKRTAIFKCRWKSHILAPEEEILSVHRKSFCEGNILLQGEIWMAFIFFLKLSLPFYSPAWTSDRMWRCNTLRSVGLPKQAHNIQNVLCPNSINYKKDLFSKPAGHHMVALAT